MPKLRALNRHALKTLFSASSGVAPYVGLANESEPASEKYSVYDKVDGAADGKSAVSASC
ncbi:MAG: hypothetical protein PUK72_03090 [Oscillospiraceae bacterium]|nr:hypothetical protein [Oscillospiraceae bacterium]MDD7470074.1 hypothetical protein [Oscillospiraceae bacterium]